MGENSQSTSVDEVISNIDDGVLTGGGNGGSGPDHSTAPPPLSIKAIHQRDADENLFLRFLELDPVATEPATASSSTTGGPSSATAALAAATTTAANGSSTVASSAAASNGGTPDLRRKSTYRPSAGRTPFTITKKLTRNADKGYGFSIVWTHPPRIEKVETGMSADRAGIVPGDFVIFVDKHNVVTMPELDILNLIRAQGSQLTIEIFRRSQHQKCGGGGGASVMTNGQTNGIGSAASGTMANGSRAAMMAARRASLTINSSSNNQMMMMMEPAVSTTTTINKQSMNSVATVGAASGPEPRPSTACSNDVSYSMDMVTKKRLNLPQVTFSKEVGTGVIV